MSADYRRSLIVFLLLLTAGCSDARWAPAQDTGAVDPSLKIALPNADRVPLGDWPNWRGPHHDGISRETQWTADWPSEGPRQLWRTNVGTGFSSLAVSEGKLYTLGHRDNSDTVYCLDAETGDELWKHSYPCALVDNLHEGGPAATPTIDGDRVFTLSKEGHLFCFDKNSGDIQWQAELQPLLEVEMPTWGFSCSPLVLGDVLVIEAGRTVALNKLTGELVWQTEKYRPGYGSPAAFESGGELYVAVLNNDNLMIVRADNGQEVDKIKWETDFATTSITPIAVDDTIFISSGYKRGCTLQDFNDGQLSRRYENKAMSNHMANCVLWEGHLYGFDGNSHSSRTVEVVCMDHQSGEVKWHERGLGCGTLLAADGKLILLSDTGELVTAPATPDGFQPISRAQVLDGRCWTVPVLSAGRIYCRNAAGEVVCVDLRRQQS